MPSNLEACVVTKAEQTAKERIKAAGNMPPNGMRVGSDLHLCEMLIAEIERLRRHFTAPAVQPSEATELADKRNKVSTLYDDEVCSWMDAAQTMLRSLSAENEKIKASIGAEICIEQGIEIERLKAERTALVERLREPVRRIRVNVFSCSQGDSHRGPWPFIECIEKDADLLRSILTKSVPQAVKEP